MTTDANVRIIQQIYASFGAGDVPGILERLTDDVTWIDPGEPDVPHAGTRHGKTQVGQFFAALAETWTFSAFTPRLFVPQGDTVVVLGDMTATAKATGRVASSDWAMAWTLRDGRVARYQAYTDTNAFAKATRK